MRHLALALVVALSVVPGCKSRSSDGGGGSPPPPPPPGFPVIGLVVSTTTPRIWQPVTFDARTTTGDPVLAFAWSFGDGTTGAGREITHQYVQPGTYSATLSVTNPVGTASQMVSITVAAEAAPSMTYRSQFALSNCGGLWGNGNFAYVPRLSPAQIHIMDCTNATAPVQSSVVTGILAPRECRIFGGHYMVGGSEPQVGGFSWTITDVANPAAPVVIGSFGPGLAASHTVGVWDNMVIVNTSRTAAPQVVMYDVSDPTSPVQVGTWSGSAAGVHDSQRVGNKLYVAALGDGFFILDVTNPGAPTQIVHKTYMGAFCHNIWPSKDGTHVFTTDENAGGHLRVWNVTDPMSVVEVGSWFPGATSAIIHNVIVVGDYAYVAHYKYGFVVLDVSNPATPTQVYRYDTYPLDDTSGYNGAWMIYPFGDRVYVSDLANGLFVFTK